MKLINLETAIHTACNAVEHYPSEWQEIEDEMRKLPVIEERKHGKWNHLPHYMLQCSECKGVLHTYSATEPEKYETAYCPHCGAVMDGRKEDAEGTADKI